MGMYAELAKVPCKLAHTGHHAARTRPFNRCSRCVGGYVWLDTNVSGMAARLGPNVFPLSWAEIVAGKMGQTWHVIDDIQPEPVPDYPPKKRKRRRGKNFHKKDFY